MKYSIGAFPNMFNQLSDLDVSQQFGCRNQENNNQTEILNMMNNFSKYFDVVLMMQIDAHNDDANSINVLMFVENKVLLTMDITDENLLNFTTEGTVVDAIKKTAKSMLNSGGLLTMIKMNIPLLKSGYMLMIVDHQQSLANDDGALSATNDNNLIMIKQTLMAILNVVLSDDDDDDDSKMMMMQMIQNINSNNKKLTNNCKIEINTDNINFSYYCDDEYYEIILNVSVFLSQKLDIMMHNIGSIPMIIMYRLQSHLNQSFIVNENDDEKIDNDDGENDILTEPTSTTSQSNTNKSEYAFEKTLNNFNDDAIVANIKIKIISYKLMMTESTSKLFSFMQCWCPTLDDYNSDKMMILNSKHANQNQQQQPQPDDENTSSNDDDDAGYMKISEEMQLKFQKSLLQSFKESDQQSGIVSNNSCNTITKLITSNDGMKKNDTYKAVKMVKEATTMEYNTKTEVDGDQPMNISETIFSHINDKNDTLIVINADNTVNITCDFNYLNYKIKHKINDQIHKDKTSVKEKSCYNNTTTNEAESNINETTNNKNTSSEVGKRNSNHHQEDILEPTTVILPKQLTLIDEMIECQRREKELMKYVEASEIRLRLCGGGEGSLSGASGWGSPPSNTTANNNNNNNINPNAGQWGATAQQTPQQNWNQAAQQAGGGPTSSQSQQGQPPIAPSGQAQQVGQAQNPNQKPLTPGGPSGGWNQPPQAQIPNPAQQQQQVPQQVPGNGTGIVTGAGSGVAAKNQLEQLNSMREALFAQDGWGCQNVNQDTNWDVPGSPEPGPRTGDPPGTTQWKSHIVNNGTELWEANLRNGGQPPPQPVQKTPWNHTPTTNIGGTWGEDDDSGEAGGSVWTGNQSQQAPGWNQNSGPNAGASGGAAMWPTTPGIK